MENEAVQKIEAGTPRKKSAKSRNAKRKVGRPKKVVKRPVGRPRKEAVTTAKRGRPRKVAAVKVEKASVEDILIRQLGQPSKKVVKDYKEMLPEHYLKELEEDYLLELDVRQKYDETSAEIKQNYKDTLAEIATKTEEVVHNVAEELKSLAKNLPIEITRSRRIQEEENKVVSAKLKLTNQAYKRDNAEASQNYKYSIKAVKDECKALEAMLKMDLQNEEDEYQAVVEKLGQKEEQIKLDQDKKLARMEQVYNRSMTKLDNALKKLNTTFDSSVKKLNKEFHAEIIALDHKQVELENEYEKNLATLQTKVDKKGGIDKAIKIKEKALKTTLLNENKEISQKKLDLSYVLNDTITSLRRDLIDQCVVLEKEKERVTLTYEMDKELFHDMIQKENNKLSYEREKEKQKHDLRILQLTKKYEDDLAEQTRLGRQLELDYELTCIDRSVQYNVAEEQSNKSRALSKLENEQRLKNLAYDMEIATRKEHYKEESRRIEDKFHTLLARDKYSSDEYKLLSKKSNIDLLLLYRGEIRLKQLMKLRLLSMEEEWIDQLDKQKEQLDKLVKSRRIAVDQEIKECLHLINNTYFTLLDNLKTYEMSVNEDDQKSKDHIATQLAYVANKHKEAREQYRGVYVELNQKLDNMYTTQLELIEQEKQCLLSLCKESMDYMENHIEQSGNRMNNAMDTFNQSVIQKEEIVESNKVEHRAHFDEQIKQKQRILSHQSVQCAIEANNYNYENLKTKLTKEYEDNMNKMMNMYHLACEKVEEGKEKADYLKHCSLQQSKYDLYQKKDESLKVLTAIDQSNDAVEKDRVQVAQIKRAELEKNIMSLDAKYEKQRKFLQKNAMVHPDTKWWTDIYD